MSDNSQVVEFQANKADTYSRTIEKVGMGAAATGIVVGVASQAHDLGNSIVEAKEVADPAGRAIMLGAESFTDTVDAFIAAGAEMANVAIDFTSQDVSNTMGLVSAGCILLALGSVGVNLGRRLFNNSSNSPKPPANNSVGTLSI